MDKAQADAANKAECTVIGGFCAIEAPFCKKAVSLASFSKQQENICEVNYGRANNLKNTKGIIKARSLATIAGSTIGNTTGKKINVVITAYSSTPQETDDTPFITANGSYVRDGIVANNLLAFGTKVKIPALYGDKVFSVEDRMHWRVGDYHFDIWFPTHEQAEQFGVKYTYVEVLGNN